MSAKFAPKEPVVLAPPIYDSISVHDLAKANGIDGAKCYVAIKGVVYDVSAKDAYQPGGPYHEFAGKDASRALALSSTKAVDVMPEWQDLTDAQKATLDGWVSFFSQRYNVVGLVDGTIMGVVSGTHDSAGVVEQ